MSIRTGQRTPGQDAERSGSVGFPVSRPFATATALDELIAGVEDARPVVGGSMSEAAGPAAERSAALHGRSPGKVSDRVR